MNKKLKCVLCAVLVVVMLLSAAIAMPATAAQSADSAGIVDKAEVPAADQDYDKAVMTEEVEEDDSTDVFVDSRVDLEEIVNTGDNEGAADAAVSTEAPSVTPTEAPTEATVPTVAPTQAPAADKEAGLKVDLKPFRKGFYTNRIVLKWVNVKNIDGYRVYWRNLSVKNAASKLLTTVKDRSVTVKNLKPGAKYQFTIRAYINKNGKIAEGKSATLTASTVPAKATNFLLKSGGQKATVLRWTRAANIDGYLLMRQYNGVWTKYKYLAATTTQFKDTNVIPGRAYYYKLFTYRKDTRGYLYGTGVLLRTVCGLCAPADNGSESRAYRVDLKWKKNKFATGYQVFYSTDNKTYHGLTVTDKTSYTTKKFKKGQTVYFRIRPYRLVGKSKTEVRGTFSQFSVKVVASAFGSKVGDTYIEIDISDQHMWYIVNNDIFVSTDIVTGNYHSMDTPTGTYYIRNKARNVSLVGAGYVSFVEYWMAFIGSSYGIHDASWRSSFGGNIFHGNGSHGCVNTPYSAVKKIYNNIKIGTPVVIHK